MAPRLLGDEDVRRLTPAEAVDAVTRGLRALADGALRAPPRSRIPLGPDELVVTAGSCPGAGYGLRVYDAAHRGEQVVCLWDERDGRLAAVVTGAELGRRRTGALGAVAAGLMARRDARTLGVIGTGAQAWAQVWALSAVLEPGLVLGAGRDRGRLAAFCHRVREELGWTCGTGTPDEVARACDVLVTATGSAEPVLDAASVRPGTHVNAVGPKTLDAHELPVALVTRAARAATDAPAQARAYPRPLLFPPEDLVALSDQLAGTAPARRSENEITIFCSLGLAGTELLLADAVLRKNTFQH